MSLAMIFAVAGLVAAGTFLVTSRSLSRIVLGFALLGHAAVLALLASGGRAGSPPIVEGEPAMRCDLVLGDSCETASDHGMLATTMRLVNAIPAVCAAPAGLVSSLDLPLTLPVAPFAMG